MEKELRIPIPTTKKAIYGILRGSLKQPLVIFVHGLCSHPNEHIFYNGCRFMEKRGYATFRPALYDHKNDARKLLECSLLTHAKDLDTLIAFFRKKGVKRIAVVGHSYGGATILLSRKKDFDVVVLWDSSHENVFAKWMSAGAKRIPSTPWYRLDWSIAVLLSKKMVKEPVRLFWSRHMPEIVCPAKIIVAGKGKLIRAGREFYRMAQGPKSFHILKGAKHNFDENDTEQELFRETYSWIKKWL